jgi:hypothetical protein
MHSSRQRLRSETRRSEVEFPKLETALKPKSVIALPQPTEAEIQHAAYLLWVEGGRPEGRDLEHWLTAKEMLCHRHGRDARTRRPVPEIAAPSARTGQGKN